MFYPLINSSGASSSINFYGMTTYTPTLNAGWGSAVSLSFFHWRLADRLHVKGQLTTGTAGATLGTLTLPGALVIDSAKLERNNTAAASGVRVGWFAGIGFADHTGALVTATGTGATHIFLGRTTAQADLLTPADVNFVLANSELIDIEFSVPISGWT